MSTLLLSALEIGLSCKAKSGKIYLLKIGLLAQGDQSENAPISEHNTSVEGNEQQRCATNGKQLKEKEEEKMHTQ